ncbi:MAG: hypothetical protein GWP05_01285 [Anaerolineaceae bacterium]|nr:hypothetical protein [Anaerolineaceae bacterium]
MARPTRSVRKLAAGGVGRFAAAGLAVLAAMAAAAGVRGDDAGIWFADLGRPLKVSDAEGKALVRFVHSAVSGERGEQDKAATFPAAPAGDRQKRIIFVSVSDGRTAARVVMGAGQGLRQACERGIAEARKLTGGGLKARWLKLDIVGTVTAVADLDPAAGRRFDRSLHGLAFDRRSGLAFLPEQLVAYNLVDHLGRLWPANISRLLGQEKQRRQAFLNTYRRERLSGYLFTTRGFFSDGRREIALYRGHATAADSPPLSRENLLAAAKQAGAYLARSVGPDGRFAYVYLPGHDTTLKKYNILRHSGAVYAMMELYAVTRDEALLKSAERGLSYLLAQVKASPSNKAEELCVVEKGYTKLGGNALAAIVLARYTEATGDRRHVPVMLKLGRWIVNHQGADGRLGPHKMTWPEGRAVSFTSQYYPGEALLALVRIHALDGDARWLDAAQKGARYIITVRDGKLTDDQLSHDHWLLYSLNELYRRRRDELYLKHALRLAGVIVRSQTLASEFPDWVGGYLKPPRSTSTSTRSEGLCAAWRLARDFGERPRRSWRPSVAGWPFSCTRSSGRSRFSTPGTRSGRWGPFIGA